MLNLRAYRESVEAVWGKFWVVGPVQSPPLAINLPLVVQNRSKHTVVYDTCEYV